jgi:hypothetical protein
MCVTHLAARLGRCFNERLDPRDGSRKPFVAPRLAVASRDRSRTFNIRVPT